MFHLVKFRLTTFAVPPFKPLSCQIIGASILNSLRQNALRKARLNAAMDVVDKLVEIADIA